MALAVGSCDARASATKMFRLDVVERPSPFLDGTCLIVCVSVVCGRMPRQFKQRRMIARINSGIDS